MKYQIIETNGKFGCIDDHDRWILMPEYEKLKISNNCVICKKEGKILIFSLKKASFVLRCEKIREDKGGDWAFYSEGKWGVFSTTYNPNLIDDCGIIFDNVYNDVKQLDGAAMYSVQIDDYYKIYNLEKRVPFDNIIFDHPERHIDTRPIYYNDHRLLAKRGGKYGFINYNGFATIPFIYDEIKERKEKNLFDVRIGEAWGILSLDGREIVQVKYSEVVFKKYSNIAPSNDNDTWHEYFDIVEDVRSNRKGVIDREGKELIPPVYDNISVCCHDMLKDWESLLPSIYHEKYSNLGMFFFIASEVVGKKISGGKIIFSGLFDVLGNLIVPTDYASFDFMPQGYIIAKRYRWSFDIFNIREYGKCLVKYIDKIIIDTTKKRFYLFTTSYCSDVNDEGRHGTAYNFCVPVDFSFRSILKNSAGESLQLNSGTALSFIPEPFKISLGGIVDIHQHFWATTEIPIVQIIYGDSIIFKKGEKKGVYYLETQSCSSLYDDLFPLSELDLFIVNVGKRRGLLLKGQEILQPIYWGISAVRNGFCFVIKEDYSHFNIDIINIYDIENSHITAFQNLSKDDILNICNNNYLFFDAKGDVIYFNKSCPYPMTEEFSRFISTERITMDRVPEWIWGIIGPDYEHEMLQG